MNITLTEAAASEILTIINNQEMDPAKVYLRLRVVGGGCSGYQHKLDLDESINEKKDEVYNINGVQVAVDQRSALYLDGITVDFVSDLNHRGFKIVNPGAKSTCGCGSSFSM